MAASIVDIVNRILGVDEQLTAVRALATVQKAGPVKDDLDDAATRLEQCLTDLEQALRKTIP